MKRYGRTALAGLVVLAGCVDPVDPVVSGRADYQTYCVRCHGDGGAGDGEAAALLGKRPADLTRLSADNGGVFPLVRVMSVVDGYTRRDQHGSMMPEFGPLLAAGDLVLVETGPGVMTPTPVRLLGLAEYLERLQQ